MTCRPTRLRRLRGSTAASPAARNATVPGRASAENRSDVTGPSSCSRPVWRSSVRRCGWRVNRTTTEPTAGSSPLGSRSVALVHTRVEDFGSRRAPPAVRGAPRVPSRPSASVSSDSCRRSSPGSKPLHVDGPPGVASDVRNVAAASAITLVRQQPAEAVGPAGKREYARRHAGRLRSDRHGGGPACLGHEQVGVAPASSPSAPNSSPATSTCPGPMPRRQRWSKTQRQSPTCPSGRSRGASHRS